MLLSIDTLLRRHRRQARWALAVVAVCAAALTVHAPAMHGAMSELAVGNGAALCLALGGALAVAGAAVFAARCAPRRPAWLITIAQPPSPAFVPAASGVLVRAGPSGTHVLRL